VVLRRMGVLGIAARRQRGTRSHPMSVNITRLQYEGNFNLKLDQHFQNHESSQPPVAKHMLGHM
jgi:hypothetical protein